MKGQQQQRRSHGLTFAVIYLLITIAIGVAIFTLKPAKEPFSLELPDDVEVIAKTSPTNKSPVPTRERDPNPLPPKAITTGLDPAPDSDPDKDKKPKSDSTKTATSDKDTGKSPPVTEPEPKKPAAPELTPEQEREIEELYPFPVVRPLMEIVDNWQNIPQSAYPKLVAIRKPLSFDMSQGGATVARGKLPIGSMMVPVRLSGEDLTLVTAGAAPIRVTVPVSDTDFIELIETRYNNFVEQTEARIIAQREAERSRILGAAAHEVGLSSWNDGSDSRFDPAKASLQRGEVATYSLIDASKWRWGGTETIGGEDYETAFVLIVSEAAFGVTERELKVLLQGGKAVRWIDPSSGETI